MARRIETVFAGVDEMTDVLKRIASATEATSEALTKTKKATAENETQQKKSALTWTELKSKIDLARTAIGKIRDVVSKAVEFVAFGASVDRATSAMDNLAAGFGYSGEEIIKSMQESSDFTIDKMTAISAANKAMMLDVAKSPAEFAELAKQATLLGRAMGQDAAKSIDDFVVAAGRQSKMIADNLGLMVGAEAANKRYAESHGILVKDMDDAAKKQAFLQEMLRQARLKTDDLSKSTGDLATNLEILSSAAKDARAGLAEVAAEAITGEQDVAGLAREIRGLPDAARSLLMVQQMWWKLHQAVRGNEQAALDLKVQWKETTDWANEAVNRIQGMTKVEGLGWIDKSVAEGWEDRARALNKYVAALESTDDAAEEAVDVAEKSSYRKALALKREMEELDYYEEEGDNYVNTAIEMARATQPFTKRLEEARKATEAYGLSIKNFSLDASMRWTDYYRDIKESAADYEDEVEKLKIEHLEKVAELEKKGQATLIKIDVDAEQAKLDDLKERLAIALQQQSEFTDKTKESSRMSKERQLANLRDQISTQEQLLDDFYNGRLVAQGQNVSALLSEEEARYAEELDLLKGNRAEQEAEQKRSLGTMILQHFDSWAQISGISADKAMEMRIAIATEYGLMDAGSARVVGSMVEGWEDFASGATTNAQTVIDQVNAVTTAVNNMPSVKVITIETRMKQIIAHGGGWQEQMPGEETVGPTPQEKEAGKTATASAVSPTAPAPKVKKPTTPLTMQMGGGFTVPPGYPNDSFLVGVSSGEKVMVANAGMQESYQRQTKDPRGLGSFWNAAVGQELRQPGGGNISDLIKKLPAATTAAEPTGPRPITYMYIVHIHGDVWSDAKVREIATAIERLAPKTGVRVYSGAYQS